jgi:hypothetical protein
MPLPARLLACGAAAVIASGLVQLPASAESPAGHDDIRFATFNIAFERSEEGELIEDLSTPDDEQARNVAEIIQRVRPDVLLLNEFDYDPEGRGLELFQDNYLSVGQQGADPIDYPHVFVAPSNTGVPSGFDLDRNGEVVTEPGEPGYGEDAFGFGDFPGHYAMAVLSKHPIDTDGVRTFQHFRWADMPGALLPEVPETGESWYSEQALEEFRLSSKSHWDLPVLTPRGRTVHLLASHPTPPSFDGEEQRNVRRNHDEIRFWADYVSPRPGDSAYIYDDKGGTGGLEPGSRFVIAGDQNADPHDGDSWPGAIDQLLEHRRVNASEVPASEGAVEAAERQGGANDEHTGPHAHDTADFNPESPGNLRVDYVLPSRGMPVRGSGVFWPTADDPLFRLTTDYPPSSSDHRLVWVDLRV